MTKGTDRRTALRVAMAAALAPAICTAPAVSAATTRLISPPANPMRYSRTVTRELVDGTPFSVTREFDVSFRQFAGGFMMHGRQDEVEVECPGVLAEFAELERQRDESGLFPIALDAFGQILSSQIALPAGQDVRRAVDGALADLANQPINENEREQLSGFVAVLHQAGHRVTAHLPTDLFAPSSLSRRDEQSIAIPGGREGSVETIFECSRDADTGLMRAASRSIVTRVGETSRTIREHWSLAAI